MPVAALIIAPLVKGKGAKARIKAATIGPVMNWKAAVTGDGIDCIVAGPFSGGQELMVVPFSINQAAAVVWVVHGYQIARARNDMGGVWAGEPSSCALEVRRGSGNWTIRSVRRE
jgi:hypothetical protein